MTTPRSIMLHRKFGAGTSRTAGGSRTSTDRLPARRTTRISRWVTIPSNSIPREHRTVVKVTVMLEELLALGHGGAEYDAWLIRIDQGDQFSSGFVALNPNSNTRLWWTKATRCLFGYSSGAILIYLAEKFGVFLPTGNRARAECLSWLFWQAGSAPYVGGGFGHFYAYAPTRIEYAIDRFTMEAKRQLDVLDRRLEANEYIAGSDYTIADIAVWPWYAGSDQGLALSGCRIPSGTRVQERWALGRSDRQAASRPARANGQPRHWRTLQSAARAP